ncbi:hypothetical protein FSP39_020025 [Pinctada imbricata]|uniref:Carboxylesterase type B domain-containing protein n=1 Tax=Pinctada imbricata TaxID=66713 RepID=A0AA88XTI2_PINIB|nr:hypothetical protein FSP39_020025 [Pinctada imbricata]
MTVKQPTNQKKNIDNTRNKGVNDYIVRDEYGNQRLQCKYTKWTNKCCQRPVKPQAWDGEYNANSYPPACPQMIDFHYINLHKPFFQRENEDCLYLNIYVPHTKQSHLKYPVLFYIHGGSNEVGMGAMFDGDVLAGFLGARKEGLEGNYGFLDQVAAMTWVKDNINRFSGDPNKITIDGHSAGAADVGFHLISPLTRGLFRFAIVQSGSPLAFWAMSRPEWEVGSNINRRCENISCPLGQKTKQHLSYKEYLKTLPTKLIQNMPGRPTPGNLITFPAVVDGHFLTERPLKSLKQGTINGESFLLSFTKDEGSQHASLLLDHYKGAFPDSALRDAIQLYRVAFPEICGVTGVPHGRDLFYLFGAPLVGHPLYSYTEKDRNASRMTIKLWSNFVKTGCNMSTGKVRNPVSVTRAQKLPPIREETFSGSTSGTPHPPEMHYGIRRKAPTLEPQKTQVHVRPLPSNRTNKQKYVSPPNTSRFETDPKPLIPVYEKPLAPIDTRHTLVDGVVADYLHYAKYGHVIPIYEGSGIQACPCCTDRNKENVRSLLGFPSSLSDVPATFSDVKKQAWRSPRETQNEGSHPEYRFYNPGQSWLSTQPLPYASNYLNPEFNRPAVLHNYKVGVRTEKENNYINSKVLDASKQYEESMKKLEKYAGYQDTSRSAHW